MVWSWFDGREAAEFGVTLANYFAERVPPGSISATDRKSVLKAGKVTANVHAQLQQFRTRHPLNIYKKAKLANAFRWRLVELGYDRQFVAEISQEMLGSM
jgi:hypothetical protein